MPSNVDILTSVSADMALETPQAVLQWEFDNPIPEVDRVKVNRSTFRYPEDDSEGDSLLDEAQTSQASLRTSFSDTTPEKDRVHYYSVFFDHFKQFSMTQELEQDIERLGVIRGVNLHCVFVEDEDVGTGTGAQDTFTGTLANSPIKPYSVVITSVVSSSPVTVVDDGAGNLIGDVGAGTNTIDYETGDFDVTFSGNVDATEDVLVDYCYGDESYWILARDNDNETVLYSWNTRTTLVDERINLTSILRSGERGVSLVDYIPSSSDRTFEIATSERFIQVTVDTDAETIESADIVAEWDFEGALDTGFEVVGASKDDISTSATAVTRGVRLLDKANEKAPLFTLAGALSRDMDLVGLTADIKDNLRGITFHSFSELTVIGNDKVLYGIDTTEVSPTNLDITAVFPVRYVLNAGLTAVTTSVAGGDLLIVDNSLKIFERYTFADQSGNWQMEEETHPGPNIVGLWHFEDDSGDAPADSSGNANSGTLVSSPVQEVSGKFGTNGIEFDAEADSVDFGAGGGAGALFDPDDGFMSVWYKHPYSGYLPPVGDRILFAAEVDASNSVILSALSTGELRAVMLRGGTSTTVEIASASDALGDGAFHHILVHWESGIGGTLSLYVDGVQEDTDTIAGTWTGTPTIYLGGSSSDSALGVYDDFVLADSGLTAYTRSTITTRGNRCHALSGRDYDDGHFAFRNKVRLYFPEYVLRNDFEQQRLPPDKLLSSPEEVIFREDVEDVTLGHFGGLSRLFGLFLDRNVDRRRHFMNHLTDSKVEDEFIDELGALINATEFDDIWNVDMRRRFLEVTYFVNQRAGSLDAFKRMVRFLGFDMWCPSDLTTIVIAARRFFDSVVDPLRPDTPFDTSFFDSGDSGFQLVTLLFTFFLPNFFSDIGATSVPATRELTDAGATFTQDAEPGSLVTVWDPDDTGDNGQFLVDSVTSDTVLVIDQDWPEGSNSGLSYKLSWQIPEPDPFVDQIFSRFRRFKVRWQELDYVAQP